MKYKERLNPESKAFVAGIIARQKKARQEIGKQKEIAKTLGNPSTTLEYREGKMVDYNLILYLHVEHHYRLEWLLLGKPPKKSQ